MAAGVKKAVPSFFLSFTVKAGISGFVDRDKSLLTVAPLPF